MPVRPSGVLTVPLPVDEQMSSLASHRRALDEIESNFKEFATLRTKELKGNAADLQSEGARRRRSSRTRSTS